MMRQGIMGFGLGPVGLMVAGAGGVGASPDAQDQSHEALQGGDGPTGVVRLPQSMPAFRAALGQRGELEGVLGSWPRSGTHGTPPRRYPMSFYAPRRQFSKDCRPRKKGAGPLVAGGAIPRRPCSSASS